MKLQVLYAPIFAIMFCHGYMVAQSSYEVEKLPEAINSPQLDEISPVVSHDGNTLFFTRLGDPAFNRTLLVRGTDISRKYDSIRYFQELKQVFETLASAPVENVIESDFNQDVWMAEADGSGKYTRVSHPGYPLNNALPNSITSMTPQINQWVVINQFEESGDMSKGFSLITRKSPDQWSFPEKLDIEGFTPSGSDVNLAMSPNGDILVLSMPGERGDNDLYVSFRIYGRRYSAPQNLGPAINSEANDLTPFISHDNRTMYFASNRTDVNGGSDLFMVQRLDDSWTKWSTPRRFVSPINSNADESRPFLHASTGYLYFVSNRDGSSDIFRVLLYPDQKQSVTLKGRLYNSKTQLTTSGRIQVGRSFDSPIDVIDTKDGTFSMEIPLGVEFVLQPEKSGYLGQSRKLYFDPGVTFFNEYLVDLYIDPLTPGSRIRLDNIYFEQSKPIVLPSSFPALDRLAKLLHDNPSLYICIEGHTDNQGPRDANIQLSVERAESIKNYLVGRRKINAIRLKTKGLGPDHPITDNSSEALRSRNRRVEIQITDVSNDIMTANRNNEEESLRQ